jgi:phosphatidylglycerophosphatase A
VPLYLVVSRWGPAAIAVAAAAVALIGVWAASVVARESGQHDPQVVVVDEVAGLLVTMVPAGRPSFSAVAVGFLVFRALDVLKPWPVRSFERLPGGWGIVLDDVAAGALGAGVLLALRTAGALS